MAYIAINSSSLTLILKHVEMKKNGSYQYRRRIPKEIQHRYLGRTFYVRSLGRDADDVQRMSLNLTEMLDKEWNLLRGREGGNIVELRGISIRSEELLGHKNLPAHPIQNPAESLSLTSMLDLYLSFHPKGGQKSFRRYNERPIQCLVERIGDLDLSMLTRAHAEQFRDVLLRRQSTSTVRRNLQCITAIINKTIIEKQISRVNPFANLGIQGEGSDGVKRVPFDPKEIILIADACRNIDDDIRHIIAFQIDTGCRVAEIVGLRVEDVVLDHSVPHVRIRPWGKVRTLKTAASERDIPLVGEALWAAGRAIEARSEAADGDPWLFPRYSSDKEIKATHASNTLNKWLRSLKGVDSGKTTHCFRHAIRDRLRAAQVPHDIQEAIGGWGTRTIGQGYGNGYPLHVLSDHLQKIC